ncbi:hypothetical protein Tco_0815799 [Tanacetum coccineum]
MVERFFPSVNSPDLVNNSMMLLSGPPSSGKTSLLFQFAFNYILNTNHDVVFISTPQRLHTKPPFLSKGIDPASHFFDRIHIKYVEDEEGINKFFAAFHMHDTFPGLVVIDDLGDFFDERNCQQRYHSPRGRELAIVRTLSLCRNAISHANESGPCDGIGSFILKDNSNLGGSCGLKIVTGKTAKYSIAFQNLILEEIYENEEQR